MMCFRGRAIDRVLLVKSGIFYVTEECSFSFKCEGVLANLEKDATVRSIGLGYTDRLPSLHGMQQMSETHDEDLESQFESETSSESEVYNRIDINTVTVYN